MNTIFDFLKSILFTKQVIPINIDDNISVFMLNRWISMHSKEMLQFVNLTSNRYWQVQKTGEEIYNWFFHVMPKASWRKLTYIKKTKKEKNATEDATIPLIAQFNEISQREVRLYVDLFKSDSK